MNSNLIFKLAFRFTYLILIASPNLLFAQIKSGPMLGYAEMKEVLVWVQTEKSAKVVLKYHEKGSNQTFSSEAIVTEKKTAFSAKLIADQVSMGKKYDYEIWVNDKKMNFTYPLEFQVPALWQYRTDPPDFSFVFGSCNYINEAETDRPGRPSG
jgi:alkaline phosphatase D